MKYVCDAPGGKTWFRIETEAEAEDESARMDHAVAKHFRRARETAAATFQPASPVFVEQNIGLEAHIQRTMPLFLTLRDAEGAALVTAMLPPDGREDRAFRTIIVGEGNGDPYRDDETAVAIEALGAYYRIGLDRSRCYPYHRP